MQDYEALYEVTHDLVLAKGADNVKYIEIRWAPLLHINDGFSIEEVFRAVCDGATDGERKTGTVVRLICVAVRSHDPIDNVKLAKIAINFSDRGVTGFDLAGLEKEYPNILLHRNAFEIAKGGGLEITFHGGEIPNLLPFFVEAIYTLKPLRIAHGVCSLQDLELIYFLIDNQITLDLCPTSNFQAGSISSLKEHPLRTLYRLGIPVSISTDDPTISNITLSEEIHKSIEVLGLTINEIWQINLHSLKVAYCDGKGKSKLLNDFMEWSNVIPELHLDHQ